jgi:energy-coupling factor transporter ATP-binding protein EcfA2
VSISNAPWANPSRFELNPGLIAVIGARGSGKTALAEIIAAGCNAIADGDNEKSFLFRAKDYIRESRVLLEWANGDQDDRRLVGNEETAEYYPRARYLSQQFVEDLCSSDGVTDALLREIERVIFEAHSPSEREGASDFNELLDLRASRFRQSRRRQEEALVSLSARIGLELEKQRQIAQLTTALADKAKLIAAYAADRGKLVASGTEERTARLEALTKSAEKVRALIRAYNIRLQDLLSLQDEVKENRDILAPEGLRDLQARHRHSGIKDEEWPRFLLTFDGDVDATVGERLAITKRSIAALTGAAPQGEMDPGASLIDKAADLDKQPLLILEFEIQRLEKQVNLDRDAAKKFSILSKRISDEQVLHDRLKEQLVDCEQAKARAALLYAEREEAYGRVFDAIINEQSVLVDLYSPLMAKLGSLTGTLNKLSFSVRREADVEKWSNAGEALLDLRRIGEFKGRGALFDIANAELKNAWEGESAKEIGGAMKAFREVHQEALLEAAPIARSLQQEYRGWAKRFATWLFSTDHISVKYSVEYDGVDIRKLSPGTRGIVLLLLYLALDDSDDRPLIIDQPEENLDPKSIFEELVALFLAAKEKRQVIIVTHNANLVVNTDADQIIIANVGPHILGQLPTMSYSSGGLENAHIRKQVCKILEGGELAFKERARRLRVNFGF